MKINKKFLEKYCYDLLLIVFGILVVGFLAGFITASVRLQKIEKLLISIQQNIGYSSGQEQKFLEDKNNGEPLSGSTIREYYLENGQECDTSLVANVFDGTFLEIEEDDLIVAGQKENEGEKYRLALSPETDFTKWIEEGGAKEARFSLRELLDLKNSADVVNLSVIALCSVDDKDNCQADVVRVIPEN